MVTKEELSALNKYKKYPCRRIIDGEKLRFTVEDSGSVFVYMKGRRSYGWRYEPDYFLSRFDVRAKDLEEKDPTPAWRRRMKRAVRCMGASGLWPEVRTTFENMLDSGMTWQDKRALWEAHDYLWHKDAEPTESIMLLKERFPFAFCTDENGREHVNTYYVYEISECRLKAMYFGTLNEEEKECRRQHIDKKENYNSGRVPAGYDVTFMYDAKENKAWYMEEYRNCGNGHYYMAIDADTALFVEDD